MIKDKVFVSYSHKDKNWLGKILEMLAPYLDNGLDVWSDERLQAGQKWREEIMDALVRAKVAVLLVSPGFLASRFIKNEELPPLLAAAAKAETTILWIPVDHSGYEQTAIRDYQAVIPPEKPLTALRGGRRSKAIKQIAETINQAWQAPTWACSLPDDSTSTAALDRFQELARQRASTAHAAVDQCFRSAVEECYGPNTLGAQFPELASADLLGWPLLERYFGPSCKPSPVLVQAFERQLKSLPSDQSKQAEFVMYTHLALVIQRSGSKAGAQDFFQWKAFSQHAESDKFQPILLSGLEQARNQVVFGEAGSGEISIDFILSRLFAWAKVNTSLPILEIFAPAELLDADWSDRVVAVEDDEEITLLESIPYLLRPVERLEETFNAVRERLRNKVQYLSGGRGTWSTDLFEGKLTLSTGDNAANPKYLRSSLVEMDEVVGVKRFDSFPADNKERARWFRAIPHSMAPIAIWWRYGCQAPLPDRKNHLSDFLLLAGHNNGDPVCSDCVCYDTLACKRKQLLTHPLTPQVVLMLDHSERAPKITPQERGATRATAP